MSQTVRPGINKTHKIGSQTFHGNGRRGTVNSITEQSKSKSNDANAQNIQDDRDVAVGTEKTGCASSRGPRDPPQRRPSYADAVRKNSNPPQQSQATTTRTVAREQKSDVRQTTDTQPPSLGRAISNASQLSADSRFSNYKGRDLHFRDPFDKQMPSFRMSNSQVDELATSYARSTQVLEEVNAVRQKTVETLQKDGKDAEIIQAHRVALCRAVVTMEHHGHRVAESLCTYSGGVRKHFASGKEPEPFILKGSNPQTIIPFQRVHIGPLTISQDLAKTEFSTVNLLLNKLNDVLGTEYEILRPGLQACLQGYLDESCDFGTIYGHLRPWWLRGNFDLISTLMQKRKEEDALLRKSAVDGDCIINPRIPPRRIWDLFSNRVLPFHVLPVSSPSIIPGNVWAVSHSWKAREERNYMSTSINGYAWAVPLPVKTDLHNLRIELLNLGAEYVFLDVLCLRQRDQSGKEFRRRKEWRLDVPTIGYIYQHPRITVIYFNGLGEEFKLIPDLEGGFDNHHHWFQRVWTLQEATNYWLPGGLSLESLRSSSNTNLMNASSDFSVRLHEILDSTTPTSESANTGSDLFTLIEAIRRRRFSNPVDAIAGLAYLLKCQTLPIYNVDSTDTEGAWEALIQSMSPFHRLLLLICWGRPGNANGLYTWRPTWQELSECKFNLHELNLRQPPTDEDEFLQFAPDAGHQEGSDAYFHYAYVIDSCTLKADSVTQAGYGQGSAIFAQTDRVVASPPPLGSDAEDDGSETLSNHTARNTSHSTTPVNSIKRNATSSFTVKIRGPGRQRDYKVAKFIEPHSMGSHHFAGNGSSFPSQDRVTRNIQYIEGKECVLVGVCGYRYWIVGVKTGSCRIGSVKRVTKVSKVAVIMLDTTSKRSPEKKNLGHVDIIAYA